MLGILGGFVLGWGMLATFREPEVFGQRPMAPVGSDLSSHVTAVNERLQILTVVDSASIGAGRDRGMKAAVTHVHYFA